MPCTDCGASVDRTDPRPHECHRERLLDYRMFALQPEIALFEQHLESYLDSREGRFETWLASREVRSSAS